MDLKELKKLINEEVQRTKQRNESTDDGRTANGRSGIKPAAPEDKTVHGSTSLATHTAQTAIDVPNLKTSIGKMQQSPKSNKLPPELQGSFGDWADEPLSGIGGGKETTAGTAPNTESINKLLSDSNFIQFLHDPRFVGQMIKIPGFVNQLQKLGFSISK